MRQRLAPSSPAAADAVGAGLAAIISELELPVEIPAAAQAEAAAASPDGHDDHALLVGADAREDHTAIPLVTLDPEGSRDLDQALAIESSADGWTLHYAIADVAAHVLPQGAIATESWARGETVYLPGRRLPLHPPQLSEGVASLLPGERRLAVLWTLSVAGDGSVREPVQVRRAWVRSTEQLSYEGAQAQLDAGSPHPQIAALAQLGPALVGAAVRRGAIDLPDADQVIDLGADGRLQLSWSPRRLVEEWNAQLSLATGRAAALLMLRSGVGLLRTLPPAPPEAEPSLRRAAATLGLEWAGDEPLAALLSRLAPGDPAVLAFLDHCRTLLRGAGYLALSGPGDPTDPTVQHAAVGAPYAHVTAPLRRLCDRFSTEAALAAAHGVAVPDWATAAFPQLPEALRASGRRAGQAGREALDLAEALALQSRVGERFAASVVQCDDRGAEIRLQDPPVVARATGPGLREGTAATLLLAEADPARRRVRFTSA